ncbi:MAG: serine/threonine-protein kinase [Gemmataceae bacterium]
MTPPPAIIPDRESPVARDPTHCRIAGWSLGSQFEGEVLGLLHHRLRVVSLITFLPLLAFFVRNLFADTATDIDDALHLCSQGLALVVVNVVIAVVWLRRSMTICTLRVLEGTLFGTLTAYFAWTQWWSLGDLKLVEAAQHNPGIELIRLWIDMTALRWFFLIVLYGVFIPNHWKRCAWTVGLTALLPLLITPVSAYYHGQLSADLPMALFDLTVLMTTAAAVAIFGSYRFEQLRQQAFQAKQLGQYRLGRKLGGGGMGEVYEAEHVLLRRRCAIKLIRPEQTYDPAILQRFEREVQAMATLTHPNTAEVFDYGHADDGTFYYVMEYLPGLDLETLVGRYGPVPPERAIHFLRQVCAALREAHGIGLLHRDIKPSNIIACRRGGIDDVVKLLDFGLVRTQALARDVGQITVQGMVLGSPPYMSPEQAIGRTDLTVATDIYSVGGVGYFLLTGQPPFARETAMEMLLAHAYEPVVAPVRLRAGVPADLQDVILHCLSKRPEDRYRTAAELAAALAACQDADGWSEEQAAAWWHDAGDDTPAPPPRAAVTAEAITVDVAATQRLR